MVAEQNLIQREINADLTAIDPLNLTALHDEYVLNSKISVFAEPICMVIAAIITPLSFNSSSQKFPLHCTLTLYIFTIFVIPLTIYRNISEARRIQHELNTLIPPA